ncbi:hypothetical protein Bca52824_006899 [Brassica carinata]|uniref:C2H2-type domain-containing protein n=1 Tax=Brassica carinata TaxID=52824 RepID=A0A8X7W604_BRACI|nr:hypothetical protein Bca52824_006899 [Brassica carinata]
MSSLYTQFSPLLATGANNVNRKEMAMTMIQQPNTVVSPPSPKKQRNQSGNPNPDAEVIALSPKTIMTANRFLCEVCNKGFNREQNLQLHGRVHNLPWKLKQKSEKEVRRKVYICPSPHAPTMTRHMLSRPHRIKKHYYRKHCEKKWECKKCPKSYALLSDWKTHSKICGTKVYGCDCGTTFSRRNNYISHKTFCIALKQEPARNPTVSFPEMGAASGGSGVRHGFYGGAASAVGKQDFYCSASAGSGVRHGVYGGAASALPHNQFGNNSNTGFNPPAAGYNLNHSSSKTFEDLVPQPTKPNPGPTNFRMQYSSNQGLLAHNDPTLRSQHNLISLNNTKNPNQAIFTHGAANNNPSGLVRGLPSSSLSWSSVIANGFGQNQNGNLQGRMSSLPVTKNQQGWSSSNILGPHFGNNLSMGGSNMRPFDFPGVKGGIVSNGRNPAPLDTEMKYSYPIHPFGHN